MLETYHMCKYSIGNMAISLFTSRHFCYFRSWQLYLRYHGNVLVRGCTYLKLDTGNLSYVPWKKYFLYIMAISLVTPWYFFYSYHGNFIQLGNGSFFIACLFCAPFNFFERAWHFFIKAWKFYFKEHNVFSYGEHVIFLQSMAFFRAWKFCQ